MVYLGDVAHGRDNNFNLIRALAATAVLVSHAYPIALGPGAVQPLQNGLGHTLGSLAVAVSEEAETIEDVYEPFLIQSGFLKRTSRGRVTTPLALNHLGLTARSENDQTRFF